ncbi:MAG: Type 1 glutamine amidotransferase-like domain-containing protein [Planctomycetes bacterium]|nr:Type 1 glutamine amidotransferase-like domain-containing protein [Planctomycetota bacterium]
MPAVSTIPTVTLLGPQRLQPTVREAVAAAHVEGCLATITAGWEEREDEDQELSEHLVDCENLRLFQRGERVFAKDPELFDAVRGRYDALREIQELYRIRLTAMLDAVRALFARNARLPSPRIQPEIVDALKAVAALDEQHEQRVRDVQQAFEDRWKLAQRESVAKEREEITSIVRRHGGVAVAGGHVLVLLNRMRLFDLAPLLRERPVIAWSAGAMVLTDRVVLFHDSPPQGRGYAEVLEPGLSLVPGVVVLPHARRRLLLDDGQRVQLLARRFHPGRCVALDEHSGVVWDGDELHPQPGTRRLHVDGRVAAMEAP